MHCAQKHTTTLYGECNENYCAECVDPHTCGDRTVHLAQYILHVFRKWNSQLGFMFCGKGLGLIIVCLGGFCWVGEIWG